MAEKQTILITAILAIIIIVAVGSLIYVNLSKNTGSDIHSNNSDNSKDNSSSDDVVIELSFGDEKINFTLFELEEIEQYNGSGSKIKTGLLPEIKIEGPFNYTGIRMISLLEKIENLPENYSVTLMSSDGMSSNFSFNEIHGKIPVYNDIGNIMQVGNVTMILAYKEDGKYLDNDTGGPLRIVMVDDEVITSSSYWLKWINSINIIEED